MYLNNETRTVTIVTPADGPSLPTAPAGKWIWTSVRSSRSTPSSAVKEYCDGQTESRFEELLTSFGCSVSLGAARKMARKKREKRSGETQENVRTLFDQVSLSFISLPHFFALFAKSELNAWKRLRKHNYFLSDEDLTLGSCRPQMTFFQGLLQYFQRTIAQYLRTRFSQNHI